MKERLRSLVPYDEETYGKYPDLLKPPLDTFPLHLVYRNGRIAGRNDFIDTLELFEDDPQTEQVVLIGEIGGTDEQRAAQFVSRTMSKPVIAFIAGQTAPPGKRMGHAGAIIEGGEGTAEEKIAAFEAVGVRVASHPGEIAKLVADLS